MALVLWTLKKFPALLHFQKSSETTGPIQLRFSMESPILKVWEYGPGHTTKIADMPIYGKTF